MTAKTETLKIDKEFESLCPKLSDEECKQLEANIKESRHVRDPIVTWRDTIIDGHHRYKIAKKIGCTFPVYPKQFDSREDVIDWIIDNQLGRRNLTDEAKRILIGKKYNRVKDAQGGDRKSNRHGVGLIGDAATYVAHDHDVNPRTVERAGKEAESFDKLAAALQTKHEAGELCTVPQLHRLAELPKLDQLDKYKQMQAGKKWSQVLPPDRKPPTKTKAPDKPKPRPQVHSEMLKAFVKSLGSWQAKVDEHCDDLDMTAAEKKPWRTWCKRQSEQAVQLAKEWRL
jgi:hypothetical protein